MNVFPRVFDRVIDCRICPDCPGIEPWSHDGRTNEIQTERDISLKPESQPAPIRKHRSNRSRALIVPLIQEAEFFFAMGTAASSEGTGSTTAGAGASSASRDGGGGSGQRYVVGLVPASKYKECAEAIAQMVA